MLDFGTHLDFLVSGDESLNYTCLYATSGTLKLGLPCQMRYISRFF